MHEAQQKFNDDMAAVQEKYFWAIVPALGFRFVAALLLLIGGIRALGLNESGRKLLLIACVVAALFELCHAILQSVVNLEMMTAVNSFVEKIAMSLPQKGDAPPAMGNMLQTFTRAVIIASVIFAYIIALAKIGLYLFGLVYLQKKHIRGLFTSSQAASPVPVS